MTIKLRHHSTHHYQLQEKVILKVVLNPYFFIIRLKIYTFRIFYFKEIVQRVGFEPTKALSHRLLKPTELTMLSDPCSNAIMPMEII